MPRQMEIPDSPEMATIPLDCSTTIEGEKVSEDFETQVPRTLASAIALEGENGVFKRYINSLVVERQGEKRREIAASRGQATERKRGKYLQELGIA